MEPFNRRAGFDKDRSTQFGNRLDDLFNQMGLMLMLDIGYQTRLLECLAELPPSSSQAVAQAAGLNERYVREWLACLAAAEVVEYRPESDTFALPPEHAVWLNPANVTFAESNGFAGSTLLAEAFASLMDVHPQVVGCFLQGGGVPYSAYDRFHRLMAGERNAHFDRILMPVLLPLIPGWGEALEAGAQVADFGCGRGHVLHLLAQTFPRSTFVGYDIIPAEVAQAQAIAARLGLRNLSFQQADVAELGVVGRYDYALAFDAIHDLAQPAQGLRAIARSLKPGGWLLMQEFAASTHLEENLEHPLAPWFYAQSVMYCMTVSLSQGGAGRGCMWGREQALALLAAEGFVDVVVKQTEADPYSDYFVAQKLA
ncbi:MAG: class I SAM-dependent methyltransferase [Caldilineaceae bacterium]|nr:class I SAM-dependent methyltransferase [Caldilineaceae bacterium]